LEWLRHISGLQWSCPIVVVLWGLRLWNAWHAVRALEAFDDACCRWLAKVGSVTDKSLTEIVPRAVRLMRSAGQTAGVMDVAESIGYGQVAARQADVLAQLPSPLGAVYYRYKRTQARAVGVYKERIRENFSLRFWLGFAVFLPRHALEYLGASPDATAVKVLNVVWWIAGAVTIVFEHYRHTVVQAIIDGLRQSP